MHLAGVKLQMYAPQRVHAGEAFRDVFQLQYRVTHGFSNPAFAGQGGLKAPLRMDGVS